MWQIQYLISCSESEILLVLDTNTRKFIQTYLHIIHNFWHWCHLMVSGIKKKILVSYLYVRSLN